MDLTDDSVNYNYSIKQNNKNRQRLPANSGGGGGQEIARKVICYNKFVD